ncbi:anthocyanidin 3-O-glucosyltransferase 2-like [Humulus lupulus]|uniref:anthocyanidin 3-O-glucosyltransferase 2-like n=1 Tax=Humulus lupulus TaxID=3486 RepID=UPI002B416E77|nr:anthocyanidin 3-O-glucosyltransferase 2-like [Humulus lupulus]
MKKAELVFIPSPGRGHLVSMVEFAKTLVARDDRFHITILIMKLPFEPKLSAYTDSLVASSTSDRIKFVDLTSRDHIVISETHPLLFMEIFIENHKPKVRNAVTAHFESNIDLDSPRLAGFVIDMFMTTMIDVANEFKVPTYVFFTSSAGFLGLTLHIQAHHDDKDGETNMDTTHFSQDSDAEFSVLGFLNPVPTSVFPGVFFDDASTAIFVNHARKIRKTKGVILNTYMELEYHAIHSLLRDSESPPLYSVGPIVSPNDDSSELLSARQYSDIMNWLDEQSRSSVVFLCFGSMGFFDEDQVKEIACGLEQSGLNFLWSLRQPSPTNKFSSPKDYEDPTEVLPEGFLERTASRGKIISWAPQVAILSHPAVGGFVSHCGWNSILESLWFGVPIAAWPLYSEQQLNAFEMVKELGLAVEIRLDYVTGFYCKKEQTIVRAGEVEEGVRKLMEVAADDERRKRVKEMSEMCRKALTAAGSSYSSLSGLIGDIIDNNLP